MDVTGSRNWTAQRDPLVTEPGGPVEYSLTAGWRFEDDELRVFADRLGIIPLYVYVDNTSIVVTDRIVKLKDYVPSLELDYFEISVFLKLGVYLGSATPFRGVQRLRPGEVITWDGGQINRSLPQVDREPFRGTRKQALEKAQELFAQAIRRRTHEGLRPVVPLTGGRDSRQVLAELARQRVPDLSTITIKSWNRYTEDVRVAQALSAFLDVPHTLLDYRKDSFFKRLEDQILINNLETVKHEWTQVIADELAGQRCIVYDGIAGDALLNSAYARVLPADLLSRVQSGSLEKIADAIVHDNYRFPQYLKRLPGCDDFEERLRDRIVAELDRHSGTPDIICRYMFEHRTRRPTGAQALAGLGNRIEVCLPYLDEDIVALGFSLPIPEFWNPGFHDEVIAATYPELSQIDYENLDLKPACKPDPFADWLQLWIYLPRLIRGCASKMVDALFVLSRFADSFLKLRMSEFLYISDRQMYISVLQDLSSPTAVATRETESTQDRQYES